MKHGDRYPDDDAGRVRRTPDEWASPGDELGAPTWRAAGGRWSPTAAVALVLAGAALLIFFFAIIGHILLMIFGGTLLAVLLRACTDWISGKTGLGDGWSLAIMLLAAVCLIVAGAYFLAPRVADQLDQFWQDLPQYIDRLRSFVGQFAWGRALLRQFSPAQASGGAVVSTLSGAAITLGAVVTDFAIVLFVGIYLAVEPALYVGGIVRLFPSPRRPRARQVMQEASVTLGRWLLGRFFSMAVIGVLIGVGLWVLGVPLALSLGIWSALMTFLPNIGPILGTIPNAIVALQAGGAQLALYVVLLHVVAQIIESYFLTPLVQLRAVRLPPALTISSQAVMGVLFGLAGLALAAPLAALGMTLTRQVYIGDYLGDEAAKHGTASGEPH